MNDLSQYDIFLKKSLKNNTSEQNLSENYSSSISFADQFIKKQFKQKKENLSNFSNKKTKSDQQKNNESVGKDSGKWDNDKHYRYKATYKNKDSLSWNFLDLQNKKQTGDLYRKIVHFHKTKGFKSFNFTSSRGKEGVTTVLANLLTYIRNQVMGKKVIVIDANLQSPNLHKIFNIPNKYGFIDIFNEKIEINEAVIPISPSIYLLTGGKDSNKTAGNLNQDNFISLIDHCKEFYDYIFIDCAPVIISPDALTVASAADISFLTIHSAKVQKAVAEKAKSLLNDNECQIGGVILNHVQHVIPNWLYRFI